MARPESDSAGNLHEKESSMILNICLGHKAFPFRFQSYFDYLISPIPVSGVEKLILVPDEMYGPRGSSLSEYAQLFWLYHNLNKISSSATHIRTFHYRRFVAADRANVGRPCSLPFAYIISEDELGQFSSDFDRHRVGELMNAPYTFRGGVITQYASSHLLEDFIDFSKFLHQKNILSQRHIIQFLRENTLIAASSIFLLRITNFRWITSILLKASAYMNEENFIERDGYQRRNMGFLLERLNSYLLLEGMRQGIIEKNTGSHMIISEDSQISITTEIG
jgi:hypothetical protein